MKGCPFYGQLEKSNNIIMLHKFRNFLTMNLDDETFGFAIMNNF